MTLQLVFGISLFFTFVNLSCVAVIHKFGSKMGKPLRILMFAAVVLTAAPALAWLEMFPWGPGIGVILVLAWILNVWYRVMSQFKEPDRNPDPAHGTWLKL
jgi:hypothetical protein